MSLVSNMDGWGDEADPHFAFDEGFETQMENFWKDENPSAQRAEEISKFFEEEENLEFEEEQGELLDLNGILEKEEEEALSPEDMALLEAIQEQEQMPKEKVVLDRFNVEQLVNMLARVRLAWPENLPGYDAKEFASDLERADYPASFYTNTLKEKTVLWHAENFRRQFATQFPKRRALVIAPKNETGCQKLFPTFLNPCVLGYPEFLEFNSLAAFLKEFFAPQMMEHPTRFPDKISSHVTVLKNRKANCFEFAIVLATFLIGAGYDAYVVDGYASKGVCTQDATQDFLEPFETEEPEIVGSTPQQQNKKKDSAKEDSRMSFDFGSLFKKEEEEEEERPVSPSKYRFKKKAPVVSQIWDPEEDDEEEEEEEEEEEASETEKLPAGDDLQDGEKEGEEVEEEEDGDEEEDEEQQELIKKRPRPNCPEPYYACRTHAWVLVKEGKRGVEVPFFIEPFSGSQMFLEDESFFGIEALFNHKNYYVNLQDPTEFYAGEISYDLDDKEKWAKFLLEPEKKRKVKESDENEADSLFADDEDDAPKKAELLLDMPLSFTPEPDIPQDDYDRKYPGGAKTFNYNNAIVELAAPYVNGDGSVEKVLKFSGTERSPDDLEYIQEKFENRKDKLVRRKWYREGAVVHEYFDKGRKDALKEHVHISGKNKATSPRDLYYYANAHPQSVSHRKIMKKGMIEYFEGRDDNLYYRFTTYSGFYCDSLPEKQSLKSMEAEGEEEEEPHSKSKAKEFLELLKGNAPGAPKRVRRRLNMIIEKYARDPRKISEDDIAEKHMHIKEGRLCAAFHYGDGNLTRHTIEFFKPKGCNPDITDFRPEDSNEYLPDPHAPPTDVYKGFKLVQRMIGDQRMASILAAQSEEEVFETVTSRVQEDFAHEIEPDPFAGERNEEYIKLKEQKVTDDDQELEEDFSGFDFTTPFFEKFGVPRNKTEEVLMKKRIMLNAKIKLVKKAQSIREAYEREAGHLSEKMRWHDRHIEKMTQSQEEDFGSMYKERLFEMHIQEKRLIRHQELAPRNYYNLLLKVLKHPQLNKWSNKKIPPPRPITPEMTEEEKARLAALALKGKDCCQFYTVKYTEPNKREQKKANHQHQATTETHEEQPNEPKPEENISAPAPVQ